MEIGVDPVPKVSLLQFFTGIACDGLSSIIMVGHATVLDNEDRNPLTLIPHRMRLCPDTLVHPSYSIVN
jgi:hypothetical protein